MKIKNHISALFSLSIAIITTTSASVNVSVDFTIPENVRETLYEMWGVANRISPIDGVSVRSGMMVNTIRMIGGILKTENGEKVPDQDFDLCSYDETTQSYIYNFSPLLARIDAIIAGGTQIHQIVLDQPPWAFQRGYTFIPTGQQDGVHFRENERQSVYGNSLPPSDKVAYFKFIQALMQSLLDEYGEATVKSWRFRIGSEIETPDHWYGTEQDFIEHFANSVAAVRSILPDAIVGVHTRTPDFVYTKNNLLNYKGQVVKSFANALIDYCYENNIRYDFWGISDYPIIVREKTRHPKQKFNEMFEQLLTHPKWRAGTILDVEEFSVVTKISGNLLVSSNSAQADSFYVAMSDHFYTNGVAQIFQWGQRSSSQPNWRTEALSEMVGKVRYQAEISSSVLGEGDHIGAIIATKTSDSSIDIIIHNYDPADLEADDTKEIKVDLTTEFPVGTRFYFRKTLAGKEQHAFHNFMKGESAAGWLKSGFTQYGSPEAVLNEEGLAAWARYENPTPRTWTAWQSAETLPRPSGETGSIVEIDTQLPLFSFEKIEVKWVQQKPGSLLIGWDRRTSHSSPVSIIYDRVRF